MKLICLNVWGGMRYAGLVKFIKQQSKDTDIFCFQEIFSTTSSVKKRSGYRTNLLEELSKILKYYQVFFAPIQDNYLMGSFQEHYTNFPLKTGQAIFVKKDLKVLQQGDFFVFRTRNSQIMGDTLSVPRNVIHLTIAGETPLTICNLHGIWTRDKFDNPSRIKQSKMVLDFIKKQKGKSILCGDFNLNPNTKSIGMLGEQLKDLIKEFNIRTTRTKFYPGKEKFADYTFVSRGIKVKDFRVPELEISDHLPMILEFE